MGFRPLGESWEEIQGTASVFAAKECTVPGRRRKEANTHMGGGSLSQLSIACVLVLGLPSAFASSATAIARSAYIPPAFLTALCYPSVPTFSSHFY